MRLEIYRNRDGTTDSIALQRQLQRFQDDRDVAAGRVSWLITDLKLIEYIKTLLNNNASEYFFLYPEARLGFIVGMCAFLRESIPLRSYMHYDTFLNARVCSLNPTFQAKLGWLVGHIYSRVATDDWVPSAGTQDEFNDIATRLADGACTWVEDRKGGKHVKRSVPITATAAEIIIALDAAKIKSKRTEVLERICKVISDKYPAEYTKLKNLYQPAWSVTSGDSQRG